MGDPLTNQIISTVGTAVAETLLKKGAQKVKDKILGTKRARMDVDDEESPGSRSTRSGEGVSTFAEQPTRISYDVTVTYNTDLLLTDLGENEAYFIPTGIYDWWLTRPSYDTTKSYYTYQYIDGFNELLFYPDTTTRTSRRDYFHYVQPLDGHVEIKDWFFYFDTLEGADKAKVTLGSEQAFINFGTLRTSSVKTLAVKWDSGAYPSSVMFAKQTLPKCTINMSVLNESEDRQSIRPRAAMKLSHYFNNPLPSSVRFVKPVINAYSESNQGSNMNFTYMPFKNTLLQSMTTSQNKPDCATYGYSFTGLYSNGYPPCSQKLPNPAFLLWFPRLKLHDGTFQKFRAIATMTTTARFRLYARSIKSDAAHQYDEAFLSSHYAYGSYQQFLKYPVTGSM